ncbi:MAG: YidC/Oxa1 family membrane protein insertase [Candidatus Gracilibacteria bacterium]|nr:YidC/Oxa1 family membrane protein insertase [Candidatus Gracilibacteria bacterium]
MKDKFFNFLLIFAITFLIVSTFTNPKKGEVKPELIFEPVSQNYTIPNAPELKVINNTSSEVNFNTCKNITLFKGADEISLNNNACEDIILKTGETKIINYENSYNDFLIAANYNAKLTGLDKDYSTSFNIENKGFINKIFSYLLYAPVYNLFAFLMTNMAMSLGFAIIAITILIRLALVYPQHKMMVSQKKLQAIQPKIKKLQEQYKGKQQELGMKLMELYKKEGVNPVGSCLPLLIQMPILLVVYYIIKGVREPENLYYIYNFFGNFDINAINHNFFGVDILAVSSSLGLLGIAIAIVVALLQFAQIKLSFALNKNPDEKKDVVLEKKKNSSKVEVKENNMPDTTEMMNKMMLYFMPIMIGFVTYTLFAGLALYWAITSIFMIIQQLVVNKIGNKNS